MRYSGSKALVQWSFPQNLHYISPSIRLVRLLVSRKRLFSYETGALSISLDNLAHAAAFTSLESSHTCSRQFPNESTIAVSIGKVIVRLSLYPAIVITKLVVQKAAGAINLLLLLQLVYIYFMIHDMWYDIACALLSKIVNNMIMRFMWYCTA